MKKSLFILLIVFININLVACSEKSPGGINSAAEAIPLCPDSPNCVSSDASDKEHQVAPYLLAVSGETFWTIVPEVIEQQPGCAIVRQTQDFLHAQCRSAFFRFIDDLKLELRTEQNMIAVYSASRLGYSDFGVNRERIESLRTALIKDGLIK